MSETSNVGVGDAEDAGAPSVRELTEEEQAILAFERQWWKEPATKDVVMKAKFGLSATQYYQRLNALIDDPAALAADPLLVKRLVQRRQSRRRQV